MNEDNVKDTNTDSKKSCGEVQNFCPAGFFISQELIGHRLDYAVSKELSLSRVYSAKLIKEGHVTVSFAERVKPSLKLIAAGYVEVNLPPPQNLDLEPEDVYFEVVYDDFHIAVINKPAGLVVHPAPGHYSGTLVHGLLFKYPNLQQINGVKRPGIVHRLDAATSGLMVVAKTGQALEELQKSFKRREVEKRYLGLIQGAFAKQVGEKGEINLPIGRDIFARHKMGIVDILEGGREAKTLYKILWTKEIKNHKNHKNNNRKYSLTEFQILTGRTHQIRVHAAALNCPIWQDPIYGKTSGENPATRMFLHSWKLSFEHPVTKKILSFTCPIDKELASILTENFYSSA